MNPLAQMLSKIDVHPDERSDLDRIARRFDGFTDDGKGCILLTGATGRNGRPTVRLHGQTQRIARVIVALRDQKPIHDGWKWQTRHLCGNPACCNPDHLTFGTQQENEADKLLHGTRNRGSRNGRSKLSEEVAQAILNSEGTHKEIGQRFNVSASHVGNIKSGRTWAHLQEARQAFE